MGKARDVDIYVHILLIFPRCLLAAELFGKKSLKGKLRIPNYLTCCYNFVRYNHSVLIRQKILLCFLKKAGGQSSKLQLTKWAFLFSQYSQSPKAKTFYQFLPYKHGPFSFTLYRELSDLTRNGYLTTNESSLVRLCEDVDLPELDSSLTREVNDVLSEYGDLSYDALLSQVYNSHPWFTVNAQEAEHQQEQRPKTSTAVFMTGYERLQVDGFLNLLLRSGIERLIDVRANPVSRRYGFHKSTLASLCAKLDIDYQHVPELGIPSTLRTNLSDYADYQDIFAHYEQDILPQQSVIVKQLIQWVQERPSVLVCMEHDPRYCHRTVLAKHIAECSGLPIKDLRAEEPEKWAQGLKF